MSANGRRDLIRRLKVKVDTFAQRPSSVSFISIQLFVHRPAHTLHMQIALCVLSDHEKGR